MRKSLASLAALMAAGVPVIVAAPAPALPEPGNPPAKFAFLRSTDGGATVSPMSLGDASLEAEQTHVETYGPVVNALYDSLDPQPRQLFHRHSADNGAGFGPSQRLDKPQYGAALEVGDSGEADLADDGSTVHATWEDDRVVTLADPFTIPFIAAPVNNQLDGVRLRSDVTFSDGAHWCVEAACAANDGDDSNNTVIPGGTVVPAGSVDPRTDNAFFILNDKRTARAQRQLNRDEVFWAASSDRGATFPVARNISDSADRHDTDPDPDVEGQLVIVAHESEDLIAPLTTQLVDVFVLRSTDGGATAFTDTNLTNAPGRQDEPTVTIEGDNVTVAFRQEPVDPDGDGPILALRRTAYVHSADGGATWSAMAELPNTKPDTAQHTTPYAFAQGQNVYALACENDDPSDLVDGDETFKLLQWKSVDGGASFPAQPATLRSGSGACNKPAMDGVGSTLHIVYEQEVPNRGTDAMTLRSTDGGATYSGPRNRSADPYDAADPTVAVDPTRASDVYYSWTNQNNVIFTLESGVDLPLADGSERRFANEDVIRSVGTVFEVVFDGSDMGIKNFRIDALAELGPDQLLISLSESGTVPGLGTVDDSDVLLFTASSLGEDTAGTWAMWFDGSDIGLSSSGEDVDAVEVRTVGGVQTVYLSTTGDFKVDVAPDAVLVGRDEDLFSCVPLSTGVNTACQTVGLPFDGSAAGLGQSGEDIAGFAFDAVDATPVVDGADTEVSTTQAFFSFDSGWSVPTASGTDEDIASCVFPETAATAPAVIDPFDLPDCGIDPAVPIRTAYLGVPHFLQEDVTSVELEY